MKHVNRTITVLVFIFLYIPMIALGKKIRPVNLGTRAGCCDIAATVTQLLGVPFQTPGKSFADEIVTA